MTDRPTIETFQPLIGQEFRMNYPDHSDTLTLTEIVTSRPLPGFPQGFVLLFSGADRKVMLGQHSYLLDNATLGRIEMCLTPAQPASDGTFRYQAAFN
jgi:hypothetical protein